MTSATGCPLIEANGNKSQHNPTVSILLRAGVIEYRQGTLGCCDLTRGDNSSCLLSITWASESPKRSVLIEVSQVQKGMNHRIHHRIIPFCSWVNWGSENRLWKLLRLLSSWSVTSLHPQAGRLWGLCPSVALENQLDSISLGWSLLNLRQQWVQEKV